MRGYFAATALFLLVVALGTVRALAQPPAPAPPATPPAPPINREAAAPPEWTLPQLQQMALEHNPTLVQARMRVAAARGACLQVGLYPNPIIGYVGDEIGNERRAGQQGAVVSQEIVTAGKLRLSRATASHEVQQAQWEATAQEQRVLNDAAAGFYDVLAAQRAVELSEQLLRISEESVRAAEQLFAAKEVSRVDVLEAQTEAETTRLRLRTARNRSQAAWQRLAAVLGQPDMPLLTLAGRLEEDLPLLAWEEVLQQLMVRSPELARAREGVQRTRSALARQCAERVPNFDLQASVQHDNASKDDFTSIEARFPLPVFNRNQGNIARAQAEIIGAQHEVQRLELELRDRLAGAFQRYNDAREEVDAYQQRILPNARNTLDLVRAGYQQGEVSYIGLLTAQRTYFNAALNHLESLRRLRTNTVAIQGGLLTGALREPGQPGATGASAGE